VVLDSLDAKDDTETERVEDSLEIAVESETSTLCKEAAVLVKPDATDDTEPERVDDSLEIAVESEMSTLCKEAAVLAKLDLTVETASERSDTSVEIEMESEVSTSVKEAAAAVKLFSIDTMAVERVGISATSVLDMLSRLIMPLAVSIMLLFLSSSAATSPIVSNAAGASFTKLLMATLIALLLFTISTFNTLLRVSSTSVKEAAMLVRSDAAV
jgi:hypothetical protein